MYEALAGLDPELDVAGDGLNPDSAAAGGANLDVTGHRRHVEPGRGVVHRQVTGDEIGRQLAAAPPNPHVTRGGSHLDPALDVTRAHVAARGVDGERARGVERDVAGRGLDLDRSERASSLRGRRSRRGGRRRFPRDSARCTPTRGPRPTMKPDLRFSSTTTWCPPPRSVISTLASSIACRVTSLSRSATSSISTRGASTVSMLTSPPLSDTRSATWPVVSKTVMPIPPAASGCGRRTTRTPSGRWRGGRELATLGRSTLPKNE